MRLAVMCVLIAAVAWFADLPSARAEIQARTPPPPDAAPSTPVDIVALPDFEPTREEATLEAFVDGVVEAHRRGHDTPGVVVSVVKDGRVVFAKGYGFADAPAGRPAHGDGSLFRIGSISKTFVWTAAMMLADRGLLDLDADINDYLKDIEIPNAFDAPVTMNHLMAHRAGFEDSFGVYTHTDDGSLTLAEALRQDMPVRVFPPGARTSYSNWGSALAAKVVEDVAGVPYETFLQDEILGPLGMTATTLRGPAAMPDALRARFSLGHALEAQRGVEKSYMQLGPYAPAGAMASSAADMARWMRFHLGGGALDGTRLMSPQAHGRMLSRRFNDRPGGADLAHGFVAMPYRGTILYGHAGGTAAFLSNMVFSPELGVGVFVSQNAVNASGLVYELPELVMGRFLPGVAPGAAQKAYTEDLTPYVGSYLLNRRSFKGFEKLFATGALANVASSDDGALLLSFGGETIRYAPIGGDVFEDQYGGRIAFGRNAAGEVTHMTDGMGVHSLEKTGGAGHPVLLFAAFAVAGFFSLTTLAGAWRRQGRTEPQNLTGRRLSGFALVAALVFFVFVGALTVVAIGFLSGDLSNLPNYPFAAVYWVQTTGYAVFATSLLGLVSLAPAWRGGGWSLWRKAHYSVFVLSLALLSVMLIVWKVIFSATA